MEKFMFIFHGGTSTPQGSPEQMQEHMNKWMAWIEKLSKEGKYAGGEALLPGGKLVKGKNKTVTDGPYTEGKEIVGGYFIVNANIHHHSCARSSQIRGCASNGEAAGVK
jgi:hypothetical protein